MAVTQKGAQYIRKTLVSNERVLYVGKLHNYAYVVPCLMTLAGLLLLLLPMLLGKVDEATQQHESDSKNMQRLEQVKETVEYKLDQAKELIPEKMRPYFDKFNTGRRILFGMLLLMFGGSKLINTFIKKRTVEHAITNKKVIKKKGWVSVTTNELNLDRIESVKINQTAFDRMINRGRVLVTGIGMEQIDMRGMHNPADLKKAILEAIDIFIKK